MKKLFTSAIVVAFTLLVSCSKEDITPSSTQTGNDASSSLDYLIFIEHGQYYGGCPVYSVSASGDGSVVYEGIANVATKGTLEFTVDPAVVVRLADMMVANGFTTFGSSYDSPGLDAAMITTTLRTPTFNKTVVDIGIGQPAALSEMRKQVEKTLGIEALIAFTPASVQERSMEEFSDQ